MNCHRSDLKANILRFTTKPVQVPMKIMCHVCSPPLYFLDSSFSYFQLCPPNVACHALEDEHLFFHNEGEIRIYLGHFVFDLWFPFDSGLFIILEYCNLPLCRYTSSFIGWMVSFISQLCFFILPFFLDLFCYFSSVQVINSDGFISVGAHQNKMLIIETPHKFGRWHGKFLFNGVPRDLCLPFHWRNLWKGHFECPKL